MDSFVHRNQFSFTLLVINWRIAILKVSIKMEDGGFSLSIPAPPIVFAPINLRFSSKNGD